MLFKDRSFETPPALAKDVGSSSDTIRAAINRGELEAHNFGSKKRPSWRVSQDSWQAFLASKSNTSGANAGRKQRKKRKPKVSVKEYV